MKGSWALPGKFSSLLNLLQFPVKFADFNTMAQVKQPFSKDQAFFEDSLKGEEAERVGFEPTRGFPLRALQARLIGHSSTSPRRGWDSNPRSQIGTPLFESGSLNHSDTSPSFKLYPKTYHKGKIADILLMNPDR